jgi:STAS-like domain of unknown function (DUF4325)
MIRIRVEELIGRSGLSKRSGNILYEAIIDHIKENQKIVLDFAGVDAFASLFFNASIGRLLKDYSPEELNERLDFENLTPVGQDTLRRTIKNSAEYFGNANVRKAVDSTISELGGEENEN